MVDKNVKFWYYNYKGNTIVSTGTVIDKIMVKNNTNYLIQHIDIDVLVIRIVKPDQIMNIINK